MKAPTSDIPAGIRERLEDLAMYLISNGQSVRAATATAVSIAWGFGYLNALIQAIKLSNTPAATPAPALPGGPEATPAGEPPGSSPC